MLTYLIIGRVYNWKYQKDYIIYLGKKGFWHQFKKISDPRPVWCEILDEDIPKLEESDSHIRHEIFREELRTEISKIYVDFIAENAGEPLDKPTIDKLFIVMNSCVKDVLSRTVEDFTYKVICDHTNNTPETLNRSELHVSIDLITEPHGPNMLDLLVF
jgi:hypothetical protein